MKTENKKTSNLFAFPNTTVNADGIICGEIQKGMSLMTYSAIHLKQPISEFEWLNEAIIKAKKDDFASSAMKAHLSTDYGILHNSDSHNDAMLCARFYDFADAMIKQREL